MLKTIMLFNIFCGILWWIERLKQQLLVEIKLIFNTSK